MTHIKIYQYEIVFNEVFQVNRIYYHYQHDSVDRCISYHMK